MQYNDDRRLANLNLLLWSIYRPGSDLYVVYNDLTQERLPEYRFTPGARQFVVKFTYLLAQ